MAGQTTVVIGSTGMIGEALVKKLIADPAYGTIRLLVRRSVIYPDPKVEVVIVNFNDQADIAQKLGTGESIFCCIGTTQSKVKGDKSAYRKIDFDIPVDVARQGLQNNFKKFLLVSAVGANPKSGNFYVKLKGEVEEALKQLKIPSLHIFRPSLLMGKRKEYRFTEKLVQAIMPVFSVFFVGKFSKYKEVKAEDVANAMAEAGKSEKTGVFVYEYKDF